MTAVSIDSEIVDECPLWLLESQWFLCVWWMHYARKITDAPPQGLDNIFSILWLIFGIWYNERDDFRQSWCSQNLKLAQQVAFSHLYCLNGKLRQFSLSVWPVSTKMLLNWSLIPDCAVIFQAIQTGKNTFLLLHYKAAQATSNRFLLLPVQITRIEVPKRKSWPVSNISTEQSQYSF